MSVQPKKRAGGKVTWYAVIDRPVALRLDPDKPKQDWWPAGLDKREAERLDKKLQRQIADGTYAVQQRAGMTTGDYLREWSTARTNRRNNKDDRRVVKRFLLSRSWLTRVPLDELETPHTLRLVDELRAETHAKTGKPIASKYVSNIYGLWTSAIHMARARNLLRHDPCVLPPGYLRRKARRGTRTIYTVPEMHALMGPGGRPTEAQAFAALVLLTGMREGEACGRRWRDIDPAPEPLPSLHVWTQYEHQLLKGDQENAGERERKVPVMPQLQAVLAAWWREGFEWTYARKPTPDDFIVPRTRDGKSHTKSSGYKLWRAGCEAAGVDNRSLHSTRHTFITAAKRAGASKDVVEVMTHNAAGTTIDDYTHTEWDPLCKAAADLSAYLSAPPKHSGKTVEAPGIELRRDHGAMRFLSEHAGVPGPEPSPTNDRDKPRSAAHPAARQGRPAPWVHEATANLLAALAGVAA